MPARTTGDSTTTAPQLVGPCWRPIFSSTSPKIGLGTVATARWLLAIQYLSQRCRTPQYRQFSGLGRASGGLAANLRGRAARDEIFLELRELGSCWQRDFDVTHFVRHDQAINELPRCSKTITSQASSKPRSDTTRACAI